MKPETVLPATPLAIFANQYLSRLLSFSLGFLGRGFLVYSQHFVTAPIQLILLFIGFDWFKDQFQKEIFDGQFHSPYQDRLIQFQDERKGRDEE